MVRIYKDLVIFGSRRLRNNGEGWRVFRESRVGKRVYREKSFKFELLLVVV